MSIIPKLGRKHLDFRWIQANEITWDLSGDKIVKLQSNERLKAKKSFLFSSSDMTYIYFI